MKCVSALRHNIVMCLNVVGENHCVLILHFLPLQAFRKFSCGHVLVAIAITDVIRMRCDLIDYY